MREALLATLGLLTPASSTTTSSVEATLVAEHTAARPGQPLWVGVRLRMAPGWHTYWSNPGDSGLATRIEWTMPSGWQAGPIRWPLPSLFGRGTVRSYGYAGEVLLATALQPPAGAAPGRARLAAKVSWLECEELCRPGKATLSLSLPVNAGDAKPSEEAALFEAVRKVWPVPAPPDTVTFEATQDTVVIAWPSAWQAQEALFFPEAPGVVEPSENQLPSRAKTRTRLTIPRPAGAGPVAPGTAGVLVLESAGSKKAYRVVVKS